MTSVRTDMGEAARAKLAQFNAEQKDWRGICRVCHMPRLGSLVELLAPCPNCGAHPHGK